MPLSLHLEYVEDTWSPKGCVVTPDRCAFIKDLGTHRPRVLGVSCNKNDDGFTVFALEPEMLVESDDGSQVDPKNTKPVYKAAEDETYRLPFVDEFGDKRVMVARSVGGLAAYYGDRPN